MRVKNTYRSKRKRKRNRSLVIIAAIAAGVALLALIGYAVWAARRPVDLLGEQFPIAAAEHIPEGQKATNYNSDPPTSGQHYPEPAEVGFYEEALPDERLVHNLEHGYIVVYYNCTGLAESDCNDLKEGIRQAMNSAGLVPSTQTLKIIAVPRSDMQSMVTYTSWGRLYRAESFDPEEFTQFVEQNRNQAPEPFAP
jgi:flagellar basal body-associated protein FliL